MHGVWVGGNTILFIYITKFVFGAKLLKFMAILYYSFFCKFSKLNKITNFRENIIMAAIGALI